MDFMNFLFFCFETQLLTNICYKNIICRPGQFFLITTRYCGKNGIVNFALIHSFNLQFSILVSIKPSRILSIRI